MEQTFLFRPTRPTVRIAGEWEQIQPREAPESAERRGMQPEYIWPLDKIKNADPVPWDDQPGGESGRFLFRSGCKYVVSRPVADELRSAGYGDSLTEIEQPPEEPERRTAQVVGLPAAVSKRLDELEQTVAELSAVVAGLAGKARKKAG